MSEASFDCYLCGASNDPTADSCVKCNGQLLKLPDMGNDDAELDELAHVSDFDDAPPPESEAPESEAPESEAPAQPEKKKRFGRSVHKSVEDQRLSDALGLSPEESELDNLRTEVTSIPRARPPENIPVLGTKSVPEGTRTQFSDEEHVSKAAYGLLAILILATGWLGYDTMFRGNRAPDPIAFVEATTTTTSTTTTTAAPDLTWSINEVDFQYGRSIVRIVPHICSGATGTSVDEPFLGVAFNERSVVLPNNLPAGTNAVQIVTRTGTSRNAVVSNEGGVTLATSNVLTVRNIGITEDSVISNEPHFYVGYDLANNTVATTEAEQNNDAEISVSELGELNEIRIGSTVVDGESLVGIDLFLERSDLDGTLAVSPCGLFSQWDVLGSTVGETEEQNEDGTDPEGVDAE